MLVYQADQLPPERTEAFLALLNGPGLDPRRRPRRRRGRDPRGRSGAVAGGHGRRRALLLTGVWPDGDGAGRPVRRVRCVPGRRPDRARRRGRTPRPGHLSVVVVPAPAPARRAAGRVGGACARPLVDWLEPRRLLGVRHHVVGAPYVRVTLTARVVLRADYAPATVASSGVLTDDGHRRRGRPPGGRRDRRATCTR